MEVSKYTANKTQWRILSIAIILEFLVFKWYYPHAGFIDRDSYDYLEFANSNLGIEYHPIGYSRFLRLFSVFTNSDTALVAFQYFSIQYSMLWFLDTLLQIFPSSKYTKVLLLTLFIFNPVTLYLSNYVSSDAIFLALSLIWFTLLLKIIKSPALDLITLQTLTLFLAFIVRYNALYYPFLSALVFILCPLLINRKTIGIFVSFLPITLFILYSSSQYYELTGTRQFAAFGGWQLANNALYAYRYIDNMHRKTPPAKFHALDQAVRNYIDTTADIRQHPETKTVAGTQFLWDEHSPLNTFMKEKTKNDSSAPLFVKWASVAPLYSEYGSWLIHQYPNSYFNNYLLPNAIRMYLPPLEFLGQYNGRRDTVAAIAKSWFKYTSKKVKPVLGNYNVKILDFMPFTVAILNAAYLLGILGYILSNGFHIRNISQKILLITLFLWVANFIFSVTASPITLRYQLFAFYVFGALAFLLFDHIIRMSFGRIGENEVDTTICINRSLS